MDWRWLRVQRLYGCDRQRHKVPEVGFSVSQAASLHTAPLLSWWHNRRGRGRTAINLAPLLVHPAPAPSTHPQLNTNQPFLFFMLMSWPQPLHHLILLLLFPAPLKIYRFVAWSMLHVMHYIWKILHKINVTMKCHKCKICCCLLLMVRHNNIHLITRSSPVKLPSTIDFHPSEHTEAWHQFHLYISELLS